MKGKRTREIVTVVKGKRTLSQSCEGKRARETVTVVSGKRTLSQSCAWRENKRECNCREGKENSITELCKEREQERM